MAAFQAADTDAGVTLTLGTAGVIGLLAILVAAAWGWILVALSGRLRKASREQTPAAAPDGEEPALRGLAASDDAAETAFRGAETGLADTVLLFREDRLVKTGAGARAILGDDPARAAGLRLADLVAAEDLLPMTEAMRRAGDPGFSSIDVRFGLRSRRGMGTSREVAARILRPTGSPAGTYIVTLTDVTAPLAEARNAVAIASRMDAALNLLGDGVMVTSQEEGREIVLLFNPGMERLFGVPASSVMARSLEDLKSRIAGRFDARALDSLLEAAESPRTDLIDSGGEPARRIERSTRPLVTSFGSGGHLFTYRDVTSETAREEELRSAAVEASGARDGLESIHQDLLLANEGLERRLAELARLNRELRSVDEMKSNLLANVSHELQTPLVSIRGYTEMILKGRLGPLTEEQDRGLRVALRNIDRLISLIDSLLTFSRAEGESERLKIETFPIRPLVQEVVDLLKDRAAARKVIVSSLFPSGDLSARGDRDRIAQVFINLLTNAIKYNREGGSVIVEVGRGARSQARVEIRDTGVGIPKEDLERIFDRFFRGDAAKEEGGGSGLGLSITKDILRLHGCMIRADSDPGKGSTFSFTLPLEGRPKGERHTRTQSAPREET
jgi:signal transduction histidine kinase